MFRSWSWCLTRRTEPPMQKKLLPRVSPDNCSRNVYCGPLVQSLRSMRPNGWRTLAPSATGVSWSRHWSSLCRAPGRQLVRAACDRGLERLGEQLLAVISIEREALQQPVEESERRIAAMKQTIGQAERSMRELGFLFMAEQRHLSDTFVGRHKAFLRSLLPQANDEFQAALRLVPRGMGTRYRRLTMREAQKVARRHVMPWLQSEQEEV